MSCGRILCPCHFPSQPNLSIGDLRWKDTKEKTVGKILAIDSEKWLKDNADELEVWTGKEWIPVAQPNSEDGKMMYGNSSGNEVQFSHSPKPEEHKMNCELNIGRLESDPMPKCTCTPLPDTTEEKCKFCNGRRKQACDHIKNQELCKCIGWAKCSECQNPFLE